VIFKAPCSIETGPVKVFAVESVSKPEPNLTNAAFVLLPGKALSKVTPGLAASTLIR
jgi:hypothetical protein